VLVIVVPAAPVAVMLAVAEHPGAEIFWVWAAHRSLLPCSSHSRHSVNDAICPSCTLTYRTTSPPPSPGCSARRLTKIATRFHPVFGC
jgi:hypothetical protein